MTVSRRDLVLHLREGQGLFDLFLCSSPSAQHRRVHNRSPHLQVRRCHLAPQRAFCILSSSQDLACGFCYAAQIKPVNRRGAALQAEGLYAMDRPSAWRGLHRAPAPATPRKTTCDARNRTGNCAERAPHGESRWSKRKSHAILLWGPTVSFCTIASLPATCAPSNDNLTTTPTSVSALLASGPGDSRIGPAPHASALHKGLRWGGFDWKGRTHMDSAW